MDTVVTITNQTVFVNGNLSIGLRSTLVITDTSFITASGCVIIDGQVDLIITQPLTSGVIQLIESNATCVQIGVNVSTLHVSIPPGDDCTRATGQYVNNGRSLSVVIKVTTGCKKVS